MKKKIFTMLALLCLTATGAWALPAQNYLYLEINGTSATLKYGVYGENPSFKMGSWYKNDAPYNEFKEEITTVTVDASCQNFEETDLNNMFNGFQNVTAINDLKNLNTASVTQMSGMFAQCSSLVTLDLRTWNTANVTDMMMMFNGCPNLEAIYVGDGWSTANVTNDYGANMFDWCSKLPNWDGNTGVDKAHTGEGGYLTYKAPEPEGIDLTPDATRKVWTLAEMPDGDVELQVEYYPGMLSLGGDAIEGGTVEVVGLTGDALPAGFEKDAEGNIYVAEGTTFTVKATPEEGYHFVCWSDDETNTNPEREITMPADGSDLSLSATFAENEYDITFSEGTNPDPENPEWTATPNPAKTKQTVTVTYTGTKKVIGVKAEKKGAAPAEGKTYTNLQGGEVLHVGDKITETAGKFRYTHHENPQLTDYYTYIVGGRTYEVLRANVVYEDYNYKYTESPDGQYYVLKCTYFDSGDTEEWVTQYYFNQNLPVTGTSDGITVTLDGQDGYQRNLYTFWVHEPNP